MPDRIKTRPRHLASVPDMATQRPESGYRPRGAVAPPRTVTQPIKVTPTQRYEIEQAREYVDGLADMDSAELTTVQLAYIMGRLFGAASNLLNVLDAVTE